jgi:hypothetical protein
LALIIALKPCLEAGMGITMPTHLQGKKQAFRIVTFF